MSMSEEADLSLEPKEENAAETAPSSSDAASAEAANSSHKKPPRKQLSKEEAMILRCRVIFACIAAFAVAAILLLSILPSRMMERTVRRTADAVLAERFSSVFPKRAAPVTGTRVYLKSGGAAFQFVFLAQGQGESASSDYVDELIFIVPVQGISGPAASLFYYAQDGELRFIGNCTGRPRAALNEGAPPSAMEISQSNLRKWQAKIEAAAKRMLAKEAVQ